LQSGFLPQLVCTLSAQLEALTSQENLDAAITVSRILASKLTHRFDDRLVTFR